MKVYLVDDDDDFRASLRQSLQLAGISVTDYVSPLGALEQLNDEFPGVVISDIRMAKMDGLEFLMGVSEIDEDIPVILISGHADVSTAVQAIQDGAYDLLEKPFRTRRLVEVIHRAHEKRKLVLENRRLRDQLNKHKNSLLLGASPLIQELRNNIARLAPSHANILINGELGTGKELVARSLHNECERSTHMFRTVNCGSMSEDELDRALFGDPARENPEPGLFSQCHRGTLYLEEIDQLSNRLSIKLLDRTQQITNARNSKQKDGFCDVRIVASSHIPLEPMCREGRFREDLYYALSVLELSVPPLRERREDIPLLFKQYAAESSSNYGVAEPVWSESQIRELALRDWRGNLRALRHMAERWVLTGGTQHSGGDVASSEASANNCSLPEKIEQFEKLMIEQALRTHNGNVTRTHADLRIPRKTLYDKLQRHGIKPGVYRKRSR